MFTDRYIKVPVEVISTKEADLVGDYNAERISVKGRINPFEVALYREDIVGDHTVVQLKNGVEMVILMPIEEFESLLNSTKHT